MSESLSVYDPDEGIRKVKEKKWTRAELENLGKCPTCLQRVEKKTGMDEIWKVVMVYKMASGFEKDDKGWDKAFRNIYAPIAKKLIDFMGDWEKAADCIQDTIEKIKDWNPGATISFQKIFSDHSAKWKMDNLERRAKNGNVHSESNGSGEADRRTA